MSNLAKIYARLTERKGQSMVEYGLILSAVAVVAFVAYQQIGEVITTLLINIIGDL